jgi:DNA-binding protein Alba
VTSHGKSSNESDLFMEEKSSIIFTGNKPAMSYVLAAITRFSSPKPGQILFEARRRSITVTADVAEILRRSFLKDLRIGNISIGTEQMQARQGEGRTRNVSTIETTLVRE